VLPSRSAADPCRNIRSSAAAAAPWWSRRVESRRIIANQIGETNDEFPSIRAMRECHSPSPRSYGERVGVRGFLRRFGLADGPLTRIARAIRPLPASGEW
jgi:hypothetical protein